MQPPEPIDPNFRIELPTFEGPLDLLLHLIGKHELDILDLPIAFVTERYLSYISLMKSLNLDVASEYLVMAAKLAHIKSKMLLPTPPSDQEDDPEEEGDPREELIRRLLEYQKYKGAAEQLGSRGVEGRDVFLRGIPAPEAEGPAPLADTSLFKLLDAFQRVLERTKSDMAFEVTAERISIQERMSQITELLRGKRSVAFDELFQEVITRYDVVVTFLAILEMAKMRMMRIYQADPHAPIHLEYRVTEADDVPADGGDEGPIDQVPTEAAAEAEEDGEGGEPERQARSGSDAEEEPVLDGDETDDAAELEAAAEQEPVVDGAQTDDAAETDAAAEQEPVVDGAQTDDAAETDAAAEQESESTP